MNLKLGFSKFQYHSLKLLPPGELLRCLIATCCLFLCRRPIFLSLDNFTIFSVLAAIKLHPNISLYMDMFNLMSMSLVTSCPLFLSISFSPSSLSFHFYFYTHFLLAFLLPCAYLCLMHLGRGPTPSCPDLWWIFSLCFWYCSTN